MRGVMGPNAGATGQVKTPEDLPILQRVEAQNLAAVADHINAVALDANGRSDAAVRPIEVNILVALGDNELPEETTSSFFEAHQYAAIALV